MRDRFSSSQQGDHSIKTREGARENESEKERQGEKARLRERERERERVHVRAFVRSRVFVCVRLCVSGCVTLDDTDIAHEPVPTSTRRAGAVAWPVLRNSVKRSY
jgi:hypothetical protein